MDWKKVTVDTWDGGREMDLNKALQPRIPPSYEGGQLEHIEQQVSRNTEVLGDLLATLVQKGTLTLEEGVALSGNYDPITYVE